MTHNRIKQLIITISVLLVSPAVYANNLSVTNISLGSRNPSAKTLVVSFDLSWENSWRNKINHDAAWLTIRLANSSDLSSGSRLCQVSVSGLNPQGSSTGSDASLEVYVPTDKIGAFYRRSANGAVKNISSTKAQLTVNYASCGFTDSDKAVASVIAHEMVYIPEGAFYAGDFNASTASLNSGSADANPWHIESENAISVTNPSANGKRYVSAANSGEFATGTTFSIPAAYPKGYAAFYAMKYEINEGQWVTFVNSLPASSRLNRDITDNNHKNSDSVVARNTVSCSGNPLVCSTARPARAVTFLAWMDLAAYLDWAGLRPMTELEFEKIARGPILPLSNEYAWGSTDIVAAATISSVENGAEEVSTSGANANVNNTTLSGGDSTSGVDYQTGALRNGIFATALSNRVTAGGAYYGVLELSGNVTERVVTLGNASGLSFTAEQGDGALTLLASNEGNANVNNWPGLDADLSKGITGAAGSGLKGGSWVDAQALLRTSDRSQAALTSAAATSSFGGRGVRTYDGT